MAVFTYEYMSAMYPDDLSTLDALNVGDQGADLTVTGVYVVPVAAATSDEAGSDDYTAPADTGAAAATATDTSVSSPSTGNIALGSILSVMAVAGAAAVAAKKRK